MTVMREGAGLGFSEFLADLWGVAAGPSRRFAVIRERGALWGSVLLLMLPSYIGFWWAGGIYFDGDPFPGYSFLMPAVAAGLAVLLKLLLLHLPARIIEGKGRYGRGTGSFRALACLYGYASLPEFLGETVGFALFFTVPSRTAGLIHDYRVVAISLLVAFGISLFLWNIILTVLAMRTVYPMRDWKLVVALVLGTVISVLVTLPAMRTVVGQADVDIAYLKPILTNHVLRFHYAGPRPPGGGQESKMGIHLDRLAYRFGSPRRFDLLIFEASAGYGSGPTGAKGDGDHQRLVGRVLGIPGETVEMKGGEVTVDGRRVDEPYLLPEHRGSASLEHRRLGRDDYLVLPESRELVGEHPGEWIVPRHRILGRTIMNRWPLGWIAVRSHIFEAKPRR
jgi:hypothetical protein